MVRVTERTHVAGLGTLRIQGAPNEYTRESVWPAPFMREETMLDRGIMKDLPGPMDTRPPVYWDSPQPPAIPDMSEEWRSIKAAQQSMIYPYRDNGPWDLNQPYPWTDKGPVPKEGIGNLGADLLEGQGLALVITSLGLIAGVYGIRRDRPDLAVIGAIGVMAGGTQLAKTLCGP